MLSEIPRWKLVTGLFCLVTFLFWFFKPFSWLIYFSFTLIITLIIGFQWFSNTNLSVEITVWLAKFFPASKLPVHDTSNIEWTKLFRNNYDVILQEYLGQAKTKPNQTKKTKKRKN